MFVASLKDASRMLSEGKIAAFGTNNAILWALEHDAFGNGSPAVLHAYDAMNVANELYNSSVAESGARDNPGGAVKFTVPTVANGKVYVGSQFSVYVFGLLGAYAASPDGQPIATLARMPAGKYL